MSISNTSSRMRALPFLACFFFSRCCVTNRHLLVRFRRCQGLANTLDSKDLAELAESYTLKEKTSDCMLLLAKSKTCPTRQLQIGFVDRLHSAVEKNAFVLEFRGPEVAVKAGPWASAVGERPSDGDCF